MQIFSKQNKKLTDLRGLYAMFPKGYIDLWIQSKTCSRRKSRKKAVFKITNIYKCAHDPIVEKKMKCLLESMSMSRVKVVLISIVF